MKSWKAFRLGKPCATSKANSMSVLKRFLIDEEAASATEYAIMLSLILMVVVSTVVTLGNKANSSFNNCASKL